MKRLFTVFLTLFTVYLMGCSDFLNEKLQTAPISEGNVVIRLNTGARTVSPTLPVGVSVGKVGEWTVKFYTLDKDGTEIEYTPGNPSGTLSSSSSASYTLSAGVYKITVSGSCASTDVTHGNSTIYYYGEANNVVVGKLNDGNSVSVNITVGLKKSSEGKGGLKYTLTINGMKNSIKYSVELQNQQSSGDSYTFIDSDNGNRYFDCTPETSNPTGTINIDQDNIPSGYYRLVIKYGESNNTEPDTYMPFDLGDNLIEIADGLTTTYNATITMPSSSDRSYYVSADGSANNSGLFRSYPTTFAQAVENIVNYKKTYKKYSGYCIVFLCDYDDKNGVLTVPEIDVSKVSDLNGIYVCMNALYENTSIENFLECEEDEDGKPNFDVLTWNVGQAKVSLSLTATDENKTLKINGLNFSNIASLTLKNGARLVAENATGSTVQGEGVTVTLSPVTVTVDNASNYGETAPFLKYSVESTVANDVYFAYNLVSGESAATGYMYTEKQDTKDEEIMEESEQTVTTTYVRCYPEKASTTPTADSKTMLWKNTESNGVPSISNAFFSDTPQINLLASGAALLGWTFNNRGDLFILKDQQTSNNPVLSKFEKADSYYRETFSDEIVFSSSFDKIFLAASDDDFYILSLAGGEGKLYHLNFSQTPVYMEEISFDISQEADMFVDCFSMYAQGSNLYMGCSALKLDEVVSAKILKFKPYITYAIKEQGSEREFFTKLYLDDYNIDLSSSTMYESTGIELGKYRIADMQIVEDNLYALISDLGATIGPVNNSLSSFVSRGMLVKINLKEPESKNHYGLYTPAVATTFIAQPEGTTSCFTAPYRFIARKKDELVIADSGYYLLDEKNGDKTDDYKTVNRTVVFTLATDSLEMGDDLGEEVQFSKLLSTSFFGE